MKKRNKKRNPRKAVEIHLRGRLKNKLFVYCTSVSDQMFSTDRAGNKQVIDSVIMAAIADLPQKWTVHLIAGCYGSKGKRDLKELIVGGDGYYYHNQLLDSIREQQNKQIEDLNSKNVKISFVGWIAYAVGEELNPEEVDEVFDNIGAWNES